MRRSMQHRGLSTTHIVLIVVGSLLLVSCLVVTLLTVVLFPATAKARDAAKTVKSKYQVIQIIQAADQYHRDHFGRAPASIRELTDAGFLPAGLSMSPFGPTADGGGDYWVDLTLGGDRGVNATSDVIVCVDRAMLAAERPGIVVGFANGNAAELDREAVEQFMRTAGSGPPSTQPATSP